MPSLRSPCRIKCSFVRSAVRRLADRAGAAGRATVFGNKPHPPTGARERGGVARTDVRAGVPVAVNRFPSVLLQPLGHLSVSLESVVYRLVAEPANPNCVANCVRPPNVPRSLTGTAPRLPSPRPNGLKGAEPRERERFSIARRSSAFEPGIGAQDAVKLVRQSLTGRCGPSNRPATSLDRSPTPSPRGIVPVRARAEAAQLASSLERFASKTPKHGVSKAAGV